MLHLHDDAPRLGHFVSVTRTHCDESGNRAQRDQMLDRLMGRAVLADADRVMREEKVEGNSMIAARRIAPRI